MAAAHLWLTLLALLFEAALGYPPSLFERIAHPVAWIGRWIEALERALNRGAPAARRAAGFLALGLVLLPCVASGLALEAALGGPRTGLIPLALIASSLIAQRSLDEHASAVATALPRSLDEGRAAVRKIVGRDVAALDEAGIARAAIESLAENFSDGVVAPALWLAFLGLPGALAYKAINTADSMIGHRNARYADFGFAAAKLDDLVNWPAARLSAGLLALAALALPGAQATGALSAVRRDAPKHASPNAGWPEAAMAGALGIGLGGPRAYDGVEIAGAPLGGDRVARGEDIHRALDLYRRAAAAQIALVSLLAYSLAAFGA